MNTSLYPTFSAVRARFSPGPPPDRIWFRATCPKTMATNARPATQADTRETTARM